MKEKEIIQIEEKLEKAGIDIIDVEPEGVLGPWFSLDNDLYIQHDRNYPENPWAVDIWVESEESHGMENLDRFPNIEEAIEYIKSR